MELRIRYVKFRLKFGFFFEREERFHCGLLLLFSLWLFMFSPLSSWVSFQDFLYRLCRKLERELKPGAFILSNTFALQGKRPLIQRSGILLYQMGESRRVVEE